MNRRADDTRDDDPSADALGPTRGSSDILGCEVDEVDAHAVARVLGGMADERRLKAVADIFSALGEPTRLRIVTALAAEPLCVCDIAQIVGVSQSAVSHQLRVLRDLDLVRSRREGKRAVYSLSDGHVAALLEQGRDHADERLGSA